MPAVQVSDLIAIARLKAGNGTRAWWFTAKAAAEREARAKGDANILSNWIRDNPMPAKKAKTPSTEQECL